MESINTLANWADINPLFIILAIIWALVWKGFALWKAAGLRQKYWFIIILIVNTLGILEIIYLFLVARKYKVEFVEEK
ncbi:MAG: DUF5652 family protein [bacterium]|nr:DUF5652 family protein [bacterium]